MPKQPLDYKKKNQTKNPICLGGDCSLAVEF